MSEPAQIPPPDAAKTRFYGLLYVSTSDEHFINLGHQEQALLIYLRCAANCARSFAAFGHDFTLLTNDAECLRRLGGAHAVRLPAISALDFSREIPVGIGFASAHRKLEVMEHFASGALGERVGLVDIDTELIAPLPAELLAAEAIWALDLKNEMFDAQPGKLEACLRRLAGRGLDHPRWWGGEFIVADRARFSRIAQYCSEVWPRYVARLGEMAHQGDEMVVSAALNLLEGDGETIRDAGAIGAVARWWSIRTRHRPEPFETARRAALLHLPADKPFLARRAARHPDPAGFASDYRGETKRRIRLQTLRAAVDRIVPGRPSTFPPRL